MKDYMRELPQNDEEVIEFFDTQYSDPIRKDAAKGLYRVRRKQGDDVLKAYETTLKAVVGEA